jgi:hypothetical protein
MCRSYSPKEVWGITILSNREVGILDISGHHKRYRHELVPINHPVFTHGEVCPVPRLFGIPLLIYSQSIAIGREIIADGDNQPAVYLRIEPHNCFAPVKYVCNEIQLNQTSQLIIVNPVGYRFHREM